MFEVVWTKLEVDALGCMFQNRGRARKPMMLISYTKDEVQHIRYV